MDKGRGACEVSGGAVANGFQIISVPTFFLKNINLNKI